jgi:ABC-type branched-subunit amino acid transport system permease subunit
MVGINSIVLAKLADWLSNVSAGSSNVLLSPSNWKYMIFGLALVLMMRFKNQGLMPPRESGGR